MVTPALFPDPDDPTSCLWTCLSWTCHVSGITHTLCVPVCLPSLLSAACSRSIHIVVSVSASPIFMAE